MKINRLIYLEIIIIIFLSLVILCSLSQPAYGYSYTSSPPSNPRIRSTGDGSLPEGCIISQDTAQMTWTPTVEHLGIWTFRVTVTDTTGKAVFKDFTTIVWATTDVNGDYYVNILDLIMVSQHMGETGSPGWINSDVNSDGAINILDMIDVTQDFISDAL